MSMTSGAILITGAASGIGAATAKRLAEKGYKVYATARSDGALAAAKRAGCEILKLDVTSETSMGTAVAEIEAREGSIGALVNNAGYSQPGALETLSIDAVRQQFETNVFGLLRLTQLVLPGMRRQGRGRIVNISSMGGRLTFPGEGAYHASKYAVEALSDALRFEVEGFGIDVVLIEPGFIRTDFSDATINRIKMSDGNDPYAAFNRAVAAATRAAYSPGTIAKLGGEPDDVAAVIERALEIDKPKARYAVTASAHVLLAMRSLVSDGVWDWLMRQRFPQPTAHKA
jgi:NAD(P)-dependent dehydrogenase (short-subunit alcohol dehydrogenase family)